MIYSKRTFLTWLLDPKAAVSTPAYFGRVLQGNVSYIDPRVDPQTRTAKVRVQVPNPEMLLRIGMYVDVSIVTADGSLVSVIPRTAVQLVGSDQVVYLPHEDHQGMFEQRNVKLGELMGEYYTVLEGVQPGERVVTEGSFLLRAESFKGTGGGHQHM